MQDHARDEHVRAPQRILEEVAAVKSDAALKPERRHVFFEERPHRRQIDALTNKLRIRQRHSHRQASLCGADISESLVLLPRKLLCDCHGRRQAVAIHRAQEQAQSLRIQVERGEKTFAALDLVLGLPSAESNGE